MLVYAPIGDGRKQNLTHMGDVHLISTGDGVHGQWTYLTMGFARIERSIGNRYDRVGDSRSGAFQLQVGNTYQAAIQSPWGYRRVGRRRRRTWDPDYDNFKFEVEEGKTYSISFLSPSSRGSLWRGRVSISDQTGVVIAASGGDNELAMTTFGRYSSKALTFTAEKSETLTFGIRSAGRGWGNYQIKLNDTSPAIDPALPLERRETIGGSSPAPTVDRSQLSSDTTLTEDTNLVDSYEGYQPSLHGVRGATVNLEGDITLSSDMQVKSHGPKYAFNSKGVGQTGGAGGYGGGCPAWGVREATLNGDDGSQTIKMHSQTTSITDGLVRAYGFDRSTVDLGNGENTIDLSVKVTSGNDYTWRRWLPISSVPGSDPNSPRFGDIQRTTYSKIYGYGQAYGYGLIGSDVTTGDDSDSVTINANADMENQVAPWQLARENYSADSFGLHTSKLNTGGGDDSVSITALSQGAITYRKGKWQAPRGKHWVNGTLQTHTYDDVGVYRSTIELGDGNDQLTVTTAQQRSYAQHTYKAGTALEGATIDLGAGDDTFTLTGKIKKSNINGGDGYDILDLDSNWNHGSQSGLNKFKQALAEKYLTTDSQFHLPQLVGMWGEQDVLISGFEAVKIGGQILEVKAPLNDAESVFSVDDVIVNGGNRVDVTITRTGGNYSSGKLFFKTTFQRPDGEFSSGESWTRFEAGQETAQVSWGSTADMSHPEFYTSAELELTRAEFDGAFSFGDAIGEITVM